MDRLPESVLFHLLQYTRACERIRLLRVNRKLNLFIRSSCEGLRVRLRLSVRTGQNNGSCYVFFTAEGMGYCSFWTESDCISFKTQSDHCQTKMIEYLVLKTGSCIVKKGPLISIPVADPLKAFLMLLDLIIMKSTSMTITISTDVPTEFRWFIYNHIQLQGLQVKTFEIYGKVPVKEILYINEALGTTLFSLFGNTIRLSEKENLEVRQEEYYWKIDDLLPFQSKFAFILGYDYGLESWTSIEATIEHWKKGTLGHIAASFKTAKIHEIRENLEERKDVQDLGIDVDHANYAIAHDLDDKWLWIQLTESNFVYCSMSGEIKAQLIDEEFEDFRNSLYAHVASMNGYW